MHPGIYSVAPGETLHSVVERAGGLTAQAYLYAATFTRKSTRLSEAESLNKLAEDLEHELTRRAVPSLGSTGTTTDTATPLKSGQDLITRVRSTRATGRIVLRLHRMNDQNYELPDIHIEDGDQLVVPFRPETVQVVGAVFNPHAFIFDNKQTVSKYLHLAGGATRDADRKRIFVLHADGTASGEAGSSLFRSDLDRTVLNPGDTIVVPEKLLHLPPIAQVLAWSQALSQAASPAVSATVLTR